MEQLLKEATFNSYAGVYLSRENSGLFRTRSGVSTAEVDSDGSDSQVVAPTARRITIAKQVLAEATHTFTPSDTHLPHRQNSRGQGQRNTGALGPLLAMLQSSDDPEKMLYCLETLSFMLLDRQNRKMMSDLNALDILLGICGRCNDPNVLMLSLEAIVNLTKGDDKDKVLLWQHPSKANLLGILNLKYGPLFVCEALGLLRKVLFSTPATGATSPCSPRISPNGATSGLARTESNASACASAATAMAASGLGTTAPVLGASCLSSSSSAPALRPVSTSSCSGGMDVGTPPVVSLLEPSFLMTAAQLLHPSTDHQVLCRVLRMLELAATTADIEHLQGWHSCLFRMVPLLSQVPSSPGTSSSGATGSQQSSTTGVATFVNGAFVGVAGALHPACSQALSVLVALSDNGSFRNVFYAAGCITPLLHLLSSSDGEVAAAAACILSWLAESGLSQDRLCSEAAVNAFVRVLQTSRSVEVLIGVLYSLSHLAGHKEVVVTYLKQRAAVQVLARLLQQVSDEDAVLGALQLLEVLGAPSPTASPPLPQQQHQQRSGSSASHSRSASQLHLHTHNLHSRGGHGANTATLTASSAQHGSGSQEGAAGSAAAATGGSSHVCSVVDQQLQPAYMDLPAAAGHATACS